MTASPTPTCAMCSSVWSTVTPSTGSMNCCRGIGNRQTLSRHDGMCSAPTLTSGGRSASATPPLGHWCDILRTAAMEVNASHCDPRTDDVGTNKRSIGALAVDRCAFETRDDGDCSAPGRSLLFGLFADCCGFDGNNALDQPRSRSSDAAIEPRRESSDGGGVSDPMSSNSIFASFGISKLGASPFATVATTAWANLTSGCCQ